MNTIPFTIEHGEPLPPARTRAPPRYVVVGGVTIGELTEPVIGGVGKVVACLMLRPPREDAYLPNWRISKRFNPERCTAAVGETDEDAIRNAIINGIKEHSELLAACYARAAELGIKLEGGGRGKP